MGSQTQVDERETGGNGRPASARQLRIDLGELVGDILTLAELQISLAAEDARKLMRRTIKPTVGILIAAIVASGGITVGLFGLALIVAQSGLSPGVAMLVVAGVTAIGCGVAAVLCWNFLRRADDSFETSRAEFQTNIAWIKRALGNLGSARGLEFPQSDH